MCGDCLLLFHQQRPPLEEPSYFDSAKEAGLQMSHQFPGSGLVRPLNDLTNKFIYIIYVHIPVYIYIHLYMCIHIHDMFPGT